MANLFKSFSQNIIKSPFVIVVTIVFGLLFIIAVGLSIEDYMTTLKGYELLPTAKANDWIIPLVALLPQVGQVAFTFTFASDTRRRWAILVAFGLHFIDVSTDVYFKAYGRPLWVWLVALVESELLFTLGSELALTFSLGMLLELVPNALEQTMNTLHRVSGALGLHDDDETQSPSPTKRV
jgi:hypothetical protein